MQHWGTRWPPAGGREGGSQESRQDEDFVLREGQDEDITKNSIVLWPIQGQLYLQIKSIM